MIAICLVLWGFLITDAYAEDLQTRVVSTFVLKVAEPSGSADTLVQKVEALGGWFSRRDDTSIAFRVPVEVVEEVVAAVESKGLIADRGYSRTDLSSQLADLRTRLAAREEVIEQYFDLLPGAKASAVLTVEQEIVRVVQVVESLKGQLRVLEHDASYAQIDVSFRYRDRRAPTPDGTSVFPWLNDLGLGAIYSSFDSVMGRGGSRLPMAPTSPEGFSEYRGRREYRAVTPDRVVFRVRSLQHWPEADLDFWAEALRNRLVNAGYDVLSEASVHTATLGEGWLTEVAAPIGQQDHAYAVAIFLRGNTIVVVEGAGEVSAWRGRRDGVMAHIERL